MSEVLTAELVLDTKCTLGEGPLWCEKRQALFFVDILESKVHRFHPESGEHKSYDVGAHVGTLGLRENGHLVLAQANGFSYLDLDSAEVTRLSDPEEGNTHNRFNDGKVDPAGRFWAGTMAYSQAQGKAGLYCLHPEGQVEQKLKDVTISNGLVWDMNKNLFYYIDSPTRSVDAFDYDNETGAISNRHTVIRVPELEGFPDGMALDENGNLWVAHWGGSQVICWNPETGKPLQKVSLPISQVTAPAFGGPDGKTLYITSAHTELSAGQKETEPLAGSLFCTRVNVAGVPFSRFKG